MENASKALVMAGSILLGVLLLTFLVYVFSKGINFSKDYDNTMTDREAAAFNAKFEKYISKDKITGDDVVSMVRLAIEYNRKVEYSENVKIQIHIKCDDISDSGLNGKTVGSSKGDDDTIENKLNAFLTEHSRKSIIKESDDEDAATLQYVFQASNIDYTEGTNIIKTVTLKGEYQEVPEE